MERAFKKDCWPDAQESLLLKAGLAEPPRALLAWREFCQTAPLEIPRDQLRLVPLIAAQLRSSGEEVPRRDFLQATLRESWLRQQHFFHLMVPVLTHLQEQGVAYLVLKGAALVVQVYPHLGARPMADLDLLIHPADLKRIITLLETQGWIPEKPLTEPQLRESIQFRHEMTLHHSTCPSIDLHWHLVEEACLPEVESHFWQDAVPCHLPGLKTKTLNPADQFLHTCLHGVRWNQVSPVRWLADATLLARGGMNWQRVEDQARALELLEPVRATILALAELGLELPPEKIGHWQDLSLTRRERWERSYRSAQPNLADRTRQLALAYLRLQRSRSGFLSFWQELSPFMGQIHHFRSWSRRLKFSVFVFFYRLIGL